MNTYMKKVFAISMSVVIGLAALNGCGKRLPIKAEARTLKVAFALSEEEWAVMRKDVIPFFEKENNVKIETTKVDSTSMFEKLKSMKKSGKAEMDLITLNINNIELAASEGLVEELTDYAEKIPKETIGSLAEAGERGGKTYFFPFKPNVEINFYDEDWFNWYDLKVPRTWEELLKVSRILKEKTGVGKISLNLNLSDNSSEIVEFIKQANGDPLVLNDEGTVRAYSYLQKLWPYLSKATLNTDFDEINESIKIQEIYYSPNLTEATTSIVKDGGKKQVKANSGYSGPNGPYKILLGEMLGIPAGSQNKDLAAKFAQYLMSKEVQQLLVNRVAWSSFRSDAYGQVEEWQKIYFEAVQEALKDAKPLPSIPYWPEVNKALNDSLKEVVVENKDIKTTLDKYAAIIQKAKSDYEKNK
jgi:trehalose transport system substrate-binding protein